MTFFSSTTAAVATPLANPLDAAADVVQSGLGLTQDVTGYVLDSPRTAADIAVWAIEFVRGVPGLVKSVLQGDQATQDKLMGFAGHCAAIVFTLYVALASLNLLLSVVCTAKNGVAKHLVLPTFLPAPLSNVRDVVQTHLLDRIINWKHSSTFMKLDGQGKTTTLSNVVSSTSAALSACMVLSCAPAALDLMRGGADKGGAEAIAWTLGTALGLQYLVNKVAE